MVKLNKSVKSRIFKYISENYEEESDKVLFLLFKLAIEDLKQASITNSEPYNRVLNLVESVLLKNQKCLESFLKSTLFYNPNITEGRQLELTVFGKLLTISSLPYESPLIQTEFRFATEAAAAVG